VKSIFDDKKLEALGHDLEAAKQEGKKRSTTTSR
jgi:hypothetical protein